MSRKDGTGALLAIAVFKLFKAALLIALGIAALSLSRDSDVLRTLRHVVRELRVDPNNHLINRGISAISGVDNRRLEQVGIGTFVYAAVFLVEGTGLLLHKRWAEYLTTIVTGSFVPLELYEMAHKPSAVKGVGIAVNLLIVSYLVLRLRRQRTAATMGT